MKNKNYKVYRCDVYVGMVVKTDAIYRDEYYTMGEKQERLNACSYYPYRSMLFVPNEYKRANDLLYNSPNYPVLNITDDTTCLSLKGENVVIKDYCKLDSLLKYCGYGEELTYEDILNIRKKLFNGRFTHDNCELFGMKEFKPEDFTYYKNGIEVTDPKERKKFIAKEKRAQRMGHRSFGSIPKNTLPREYFDIDDYGDNSLIDVLRGFDNKMNAFAPDIREKVKRLKRY